MDEIKRVDPRQQRILRNRLHPEHDAAVSADSVSASGLLRKNPHQQGYLSAEGIKRIDRSGAAAQITGQAKKTQAVTLPLRSVATPTDYIVVFSDADSEKLTVLDKDMLGLAHQLAHDSTAVLLITLHPRNDDLAAAGADRVLMLGNGEQFAPDNWLATLLALHDSLNVHHWIMADGSLVGGHLARLLAANLGVRPVTRGKLFADEALTCGGGDPSLQVQRELSPVLLVEEQVADRLRGLFPAQKRWRRLKLPHRTPSLTTGGLRWILPIFRWQKPDLSFPQETVSTTGHSTTNAPKRWARRKVQAV